MVDHIWQKKGNYLPLWDEFKIIDRIEDSRIRRPKESAHMLGYTDLLRFGLVSLFNGISTLFRLFNAKAILLEEQ